MNAENFVACLKDPSKLYQINYQELKSLALQYPYCQTLQWLTLYKSALDHHRDFEANLARTAAGSLDRTLLFRQISKLLEQERPTVALHLDEVLDLQPVAGLQPQPTPRDVTRTVPLETISLEMPPTLPDVSTASPPVAEVVEVPAPVETISAPPEAEIPAPLPEIAPAEDTMPKAPSLVSIPKTPPETAVPPPAWAIYQPPQIAFKPLKTPVGKPLSKEERANKIAEQSIQEQEGVASETLAAILARQGQHQKAIQMYERLILLFPEKSAYFAARISKLKKP